MPYSGGTPAIINEMMGKRVGLVFEAYSRTKWTPIVQQIAGQTEKK